MWKSILLLFSLSLLSGCLTAQSVTPWLTRGDQSVLLSERATVDFASNSSSNDATITLDNGTAYQAIDGFGFMLTQASAQVIRGLNTTQKNKLLRELFGNDGLRLSAIRISIGASDLSNSVYSYNDVNGDTDMNNFSLNGPDKTHLIPIIKDILAINPNIKVLATPWSAPPWMKTNNAYVGGRLQNQYYAAYARYFVRYLQAMNAEGISIWGITPQNEPENEFNEPSMLMTADEQVDFINNHLGPQIVNSSFSPKIIAFDHNCDNTAYPTQVLNQSSYVDGAAFHLYAGDISAMSTVRNNTGKNVYFTEQFTGSNGNFNGDFSWHMRNVVTGSLNNWSRTVFEWNLAADSNNEPRTPGGCETCLPAVTIPNASSYSRNVSYYIIGQVAKFVQPGARRIGSSNNNGNLYSTAFRNPDGQRVVLAYNDENSSTTVRVREGNNSFDYNLSAKSAVTFVWTPGDVGFSGYYNILSRRSGKGLDIANNSGGNNANVQQYEINNGGGDNQRWELIAAGGDYYDLKVKSTGKCLSQRTNSNANVVQQDCNGYNRQKWQFIEVEDGYYSLRNRRSGKRLDVAGNSTANGANILVWNNNNNTNQQWRFEQVETTANRSARTQVQSKFVERAERVGLFPNPAVDELTVTLPDTHDFSNATLFDAAGRQVLMAPVSTEVTQLKLNLKELPTGLYTIHFNSPTQPIVRKLIKN
ncbi:RICIN domain-containing protein [Neolewinella antarctica]|uniref:Glucosylceramidase n=1 Tax=Neolewinella antarctica TaxID=442734 RepID=A0ABX0X8T9_9BACT|nr:RICIN domain-containing protein [Neolewinella antarctica]NJC25631.1 glucosylceramidase [Neolewinella antarctica]